MCMLTISLTIGKVEISGAFAHGFDIHLVIYKKKGFFFLRGCKGAILFFSLMRATC